MILKVKKCSNVVSHMVKEQRSSCVYLLIFFFPIIKIFWYYVCIVICQLVRKIISEIISLYLTPQYKALYRWLTQNPVFISANSEINYIHESVVWYQCFQSGASLLENKKDTGFITTNECGEIMFYRLS